jgi:predicted transcriptional regulator
VVKNGKLGHEQTTESLGGRRSPGIEFSLGFPHMKRVFHFRASSSQLGPLEERLLEGLWKRGHATVRDLVEAACPDLAYTTVMTTLDRLFKKNLLSRELDGRAFRYAPRFTREELHREVAGEAFRQLLDACPSSSLPLSYLVEVLTERDAQLLDDLRQLVEAKRQQLRGEDGRGDVRPSEARALDGSKPKESKFSSSRDKDKA